MDYRIHKYFAAQRVSIWSRAPKHHHRARARNGRKCEIFGVGRWNPKIKLGVADSTKKKLNSKIREHHTYHDIFFGKKKELFLFFSFDF